MHQIITDQNVPKYMSIARDIQHRVIRGQYRTGEKLQSIRELAASFGVTPVTIGKALGFLESEGILKREHGKGTFVTYSGDPTVRYSVGLLVPMEGHFYSPLVAALVSALQKQGHQAIPCELASGWEQAETARQQLAKMDFSSMDALIIDGNAAFPFSHMDTVLESIPRTTYIFRYETQRPLVTANAVLADFRAAGRLAGERLLSAGNRRILAMLFRDTDNPARVSPLGAPYSCQFLWMEGLKDACHVHSKDPDSTIIPFYDDGEASEQTLADIITTHCPGVACVGDHRAMRVYQICERNKLRIGHDISIIGLYNTPWTEMLSPTLTSISLGESGIATAAVSLLTETKRGETLHLLPHIEERGSCKAL